MVISKIRRPCLALNKTVIVFSPYHAAVAHENLTDSVDVAVLHPPYAKTYLQDCLRLKRNNLITSYPNWSKCTLVFVHVQ